MANKDVLYVQQVEGMTLVTLRATEITFEIGQALERNLAGPEGGGNSPRIVLDLSRLTTLGSTGLSLLVVFLKRVREKNGRLALAGLGGQCLNVIQLVGLTKLLNLQPNVPTALDALRHGFGGQVGES